MGNRLIWNGFLLLAIFWLLSSCTSVKTITIELPKKAKQELPKDIQSLVLVNRTVDESYSDLRADSLQQVFFDAAFSLDTVLLDLQAADTLLKALGDLLFESGRYDIVIPENRFITHSKNSFFSETMNWTEVEQLCEDFNTDAVLSIDMYRTRVVTKYDTDNLFNPADNSFYSVSEAQMGIIYEALFRVYNPENQQVVLREFMRDTLIWQDRDGSARALFSHFTPVKKALTESSIALALDFSEKIGTSWIPENRDIFIDGDDRMKQAAAFIDQGDWASAEQIWQQVAESSSKSDKSKALYNLAVAAELSGEIERAIALGLESYDIMYHQQTYYYLERLNYRKQELEKQNQ